MLARITLAVLLLFGGWQAAVADVVRVADGDCAGLSGAVNAASASSSPLTTVLLARNGSYTGCSIKMNAGNVVIDGQGTQMQFFSACLGSSSASLTLRNVSIGAAASPNQSQALCAIDTGDIGTHSIDFAIVNNGSLTLDSVTLQSLSPPQPTGAGDFYGEFIASYGNVILRNVTAINLVTPLIANSGKLEIYNSTVLSNRADDLLLPSALFGNAGNAYIANSIISGPSPLCGSTTPTGAGAITSGGGNVVSDSSCGFSTAAKDVITQNMSFGTFGNNGGLVPTQAINGGGPAQGAGVAKYCEALDARGYTRAPNGCDAGAYEAGGGSGALTANGMNGVYYDPAANGHYVTLQRVHDNGDIVVVWNTFDSKGNQAWVYGVGQLSGKRIHVAASQNIGGILQLGGAPIGSTVRNWGTLDVDLNTCASAQLSYASTLDGFGSGTFALTRLTVTQDFGCRD